MKRLIAVAVVAVAALVSPFAAEAQTGAKMTPEQKNAVVKDLLANRDYEAAKRMLEDTYVPPSEKVVEQAKAAVESKTIINHAREWSELGTNLGSALVAVAKEVGMAAAEFAQTPLGKFTMAIVGYKMVGKDLIHTGLAMFVFLAGMVLLPWMYRFAAYRKAEYQHVPVVWGLFTRRKLVSAEYTTNRGEGEAFFAYLGVVGYFILVCVTTALILR